MTGRERTNDEVEALFAQKARQGWVTGDGRRVMLSREEVAALRGSHNQSGQEQIRAGIYREIAALVNDLPVRYRPQDVAALLAESAAQIGTSATQDSRPSRHELDESGARG